MNKLRINRLLLIILVMSFHGGSQAGADDLRLSPPALSAGWFSHDGTKLIVPKQDAERIVDRTFMRVPNTYLDLYLYSNANMQPYLLEGKVVGDSIEFSWNPPDDSAPVRLEIKNLRPAYLATWTGRGFPHYNYRFVGEIDPEPARMPPLNLKIDTSKFPMLGLAYQNATEHDLAIWIGGMAQHSLRFLLETSKGSEWISLERGGRRGPLNPKFRTVASRAEVLDLIDLSDGTWLGIEALKEAQRRGTLTGRLLLQYRVDGPTECKTLERGVWHFMAKFDPSPKADPPK